MATQNALNNSSAPFTVTAGNLTVSAGNVVLPATSSSVGTIVVNSARFIHSFGTGLGNTFVGTQSGNFTLTTAANNSGVGANVLDALTTGENNNAFGSGALGSMASGSNNNAFGLNSQTAVTGNNNCSFGGSSLNQLTSGSNNIAMGNAAGQNYTGAEGSNICIGNTGTVGESNTIRIGTNGTGGGQQNLTYLVGNVLKQNTAAFLAYLGSNVANATGNGATYTLGGTTTALTEVFDQGSNFTPGDGAGAAATFTAPVTGRYFLTYELGFTNVNIGTGYILNLITSNRSYQMAFIKSAGASRYCMSVLADMDSGDTATYTAVGTGEAADTQSISGAASPLSTFVSGFLAC